MWSELLAAGAILIGTAFVFIAAIGIWRLPDFYMRVHAPTKAATLGLFFLLLATAITLSDPTATTKAVLAVLFVGATAPAGAHLLTRAALRTERPERESE